MKKDPLFAIFASPSWGHEACIDSSETYRLTHFDLISVFYLFKLYC